MLIGYFLLVELNLFLSFGPSKDNDVVSDTLWQSASAVQAVVHDYLTLSLSIILNKFKMLTIA